MSSSPSSSSTISCGSTFSTPSIPINSPTYLPLNDTLVQKIAQQYPELGDSFAASFLDLRDRIDGRISSDSEEEEGTPKFASLKDSPLLYKGLTTSWRGGGTVGMEAASSYAGNIMAQPRSVMAAEQDKKSAGKPGFLNPSFAQPCADRKLVGVVAPQGEQEAEGRPELLALEGCGSKQVEDGADVPDAGAVSREHSADYAGASTDKAESGAGVSGTGEDKPEHIPATSETMQRSVPSAQHPILGSKRINMVYIPPEKVDGNLFVKPTIEEARIGAKRWELTLVGYFLEKRMPFKEVRDFFVDTWSNLSGVRASRSGVFFFSFSDEASMASVLEGGPWMFGGHTLFLQRWKEGLQLDRFSHKEVPIWVRFSNVPTEYWTLRGMSRIASAVGVPMYPDETTINATRIDFARICIMMDVHSKFEEEIFLLIPGEVEDTTKARRIKVEYEWKPKVCEVCHSFGHLGKMCPLKQGRSTLNQKGVQVYIPRSQAAPDKGKKVVTEVIPKVALKETKELTVSTSNSFALLEEKKDVGDGEIDNFEFPTIKDGLAQKKNKISTSAPTSPIVSLVEDIGKRKQLGPISGVHHEKEDSHKGQLPPIKLVPDKGKKGSNTKKKAVAFEC